CGYYINSIFAKVEAVHDGYDEAILLDPNGYVSEGSGENIFILYRGTLLTPPLSSGCLDGITRDAVFSICQELNIPLKEETLTRDVLYLADEIFLTGTAAEITPIREVDNRTIGTGTKGDTTNRIQKTYFDTVGGKNSKFKHWLTQV
ncbi:MAG: aminotransferase class IV, partial [Nitrospinae bacterium]|nr:aminotransferase class IV [Nitrospinota bacterium]